jgi:hypothetical protein
MNIQEMSLELEKTHENRTNYKIYLVKDFSCKVVWIKWDMGHQYLLESNYSCLWKHVENNLFLSNFMKISSPSLNIFYTFNLVNYTCWLNSLVLWPFLLHLSPSDLLSDMWNPTCRTSITICPWVYCMSVGGDFSWCLIAFNCYLWQDMTWLG